MSHHFIPLNCTNCGATLGVYDDMERFACGSCGTELLVQRRGGTVSLKSVTEAIKKVQVGTDKTAAELALVRLNDELRKVSEEASRLRTESERAKGCSAVFGVPFACVGIVLLGSASSQAVVVGIALIGFCILLITLAWKSPHSPRLIELERYLADINRRINEQRRIVDS